MLAKKTCKKTNSENVYEQNEYTKNTKKTGPKNAKNTKTGFTKRNKIPKLGSPNANKYKKNEYLRKAKVTSFSELVRRAMYYYDKQLTNSSNELRVRPLNIN